MTIPTFRDVELISAYLDGQLPQADATRLEIRLKSDSELRTVLNDLRQSRALLRKLPARRAPRNFTLTPKMAGIRPPLPRSFPLFRLASVLAAVLFFFGYMANISVPTMAALRAAAPAPAFGMGGGGPGGPADVASAPVAAPQAPEVPASTADSAEPTLSAEQYAAIAPTQGADETPAPTEMAALPLAQAKISPPVQENQVQRSAAQLPIDLPVSPFLLFGLLGIAVLSGASAYFVSLQNENSWFKARAMQPRKMDARQIAWIALLTLVLIALAFSVYWLSNHTFYAPVAQSFPGGGLADKGPASSGDKGGPALSGAQSFSLTPGLGYNFSATDASGVMTAIDFPADVFVSEMQVSYIPGLNEVPQSAVYFANTAFSLVPADKNVQPQAAYTITMDYGQDVASAVDENNLVLYWWSGSDWQDAAATCSPGSSYERIPDQHRIRISVCQMGSFVLAAP